MKSHNIINYHILLFRGYISALVSSSVPSATNPYLPGSELRKVKTGFEYHLQLLQPAPAATRASFNKQSRSSSMGHHGAAPRLWAQTAGLNPAHSLPTSETLNSDSTFLSFLLLCFEARIRPGHWHCKSRVP